MSKCEHCGGERRPRTWTFLRYGEKNPENLFYGEWCDGCHAYTGSYHNPITKEWRIMHYAPDRVLGTEGCSILGSGE